MDQLYHLVLCASLPEMFCNYQTDRLFPLLSLHFSLCVYESKYWWVCGLGKEALWVLDLSFCGVAWDYFVSWATVTWVTLLSEALLYFRKTTGDSMWNSWCCIFGYHFCVNKDVERILLAVVFRWNFSAKFSCGGGCFFCFGLVCASFHKRISSMKINLQVQKHQLGVGTWLPI